jgi:hypothetical protein
MFPRLNGSRRKYSKVIELDPVNKTIEWEYVDDPLRKFYKYGKGSSQRLPNCNTLICEGDRERAFEVSPSGKIVWERLNPMTKDGHQVQLYRVMRVLPDTVAPLLALGSEPGN